MPGNGDGTQPAMTYPTTQQYQQWKDHADEMGMSVSEFMASMIEAGRKKFDPRDVEPDETRRELREQRNDLKQELDHARNRIETLENRVLDDERATVQEYIAANPGTDYEDIVQYVVDTAHQRVDRHLEDLEADDEICVDDEAYYPADAEVR